VWYGNGAVLLLHIGLVVPAGSWKAVSDSLVKPREVSVQLKSRHWVGHLAII